MIKVRSARAGPVFWTFDGFIVIKLLSYISIFWGVSTVSVVKRGTERAGAAALVYHRGSNEGEVEEWLRRRRRYFSSLIQLIIRVVYLKNTKVICE